MTNDIQMCALCRCNGMSLPRESIIMGPFTHSLTLTPFSSARIHIHIISSACVCLCSISVIHRKQTKIKAHSLAICAEHFPVNLLYFLSVSYNHNKRAHTHYHIDPHRLIWVTGSLCRDSMQHTVQCHRCFACFLCVIVFGVFTILVQMNTSNKKQKTKQNKTKNDNDNSHILSFVIWPAICFANITKRNGRSCAHSRTNSNALTAFSH